MQCSAENANHMCKSHDQPLLYYAPIILLWVNFRIHWSGIPKKSGPSKSGLPKVIQFQLALSLKKLETAWKIETECTVLMRLSLALRVKEGWKSCKNALRPKVWPVTDSIIGSCRISHDYHQVLWLHLNSLSTPTSKQVAMALIITSIILGYC